jgi:hypothetical protein
MSTRKQMRRDRKHIHERKAHVKQRNIKQNNMRKI